MWINGKFVPMFMMDADGGANPQGGSAGGDEGGDDSNPEGGEGGDEGSTGDDENLTEAEKLQAKIDSIKEENKKELDRYRNDIGNLKKKMKEMEEETMSEEEKLEARKRAFRERK